jgi:hypothetical protein
MSNPFKVAFESEAGKVILPVGLGVIAVIVLYEFAKSGVASFEQWVASLFAPNGALNPTFPSWAGGEGEGIWQAFGTPATGFDSSGNADADLDSGDTTLTDPYTTNNF